MQDRRTFIRAAGLSLTALAGCAALDRDETTPAPQPSPGDPATERQTDAPADATATERPVGAELRSRFETVYDVTEQGADASGGGRIDALVEELAGDDTLLYFPPGRYRVGSVLVRGVSNFGLVGDGATFDIDEPGQNIYLSLREVEDVLVDGFTVDNTGKNEAAAVDLKCTGGTNRFRNYAVEGFVDVPERTFAFTLMVEGEETELTLADVDLRRGGANAGATFVFPRRDFYDPERAAGSLTFRDCVMRGWGKEGLYASAHSGPLRVVGGEYSNNAIVQIRIGGGNAPTEAIVRDATVRVTEIPPYVPADNRLFRGIWLKEGDGAVIENCEIEVHNLARTQTQGGIVVNDQFGRATVRNCRIESSVPRPAIVADPPAERYDAQWMPSLDALPEAWSITVADTTVNCSISEIEAIHLVGRDNSTFRNVAIEQSQRGGDGIHLHRSASCRIVDSDVTADRYPLVVALPESSDDCVVRLEGTTLTATQGEQGDGTVATSADNEFCVGPDPVDGADPAPRQLLGLTRTADGRGTDTPETATKREDGYVLYGRLFDR